MKIRATKQSPVWWHADPTEDRADEEYPTVCPGCGGEGNVDIGSYYAPERPCCVCGGTGMVLMPYESPNPREDQEEGE
jgi:hypothetical protein